LRLSNIYGYGDTKSNKKKNAIQWMITKLINNEPVELYEDGQVIRDLLYIDDAVDAIQHVINNCPSNTIINIGSNNPVTVRTVIDYAKSACNSQSEITSIDTPSFHKQVQARDFWLDTTKLNLLGWYPKVSIEEGIEILIKDIQNNA
jgi:nucleoside-diphosphate-sugar epimerase